MEHRCPLVLNGMNWLSLSICVRVRGSQKIRSEIEAYLRYTTSSTFEPKT